MPKYYALFHRLLAAAILSAFSRHNNSNKIQTVSCVGTNTKQKIEQKAMSDAITSAGASIAEEASLSSSNNKKSNDASSKTSLSSLLTGSKGEEETKTEDLQSLAGVAILKAYEKAIIRTESFNVKNNNNDGDSTITSTKTNEKISQMKHDTNYVPINNTSSANGCNKKHYEIYHVKQTNAYKRKTLSRVMDGPLDNDDDNDSLMIIGKQEYNFAPTLQNQMHRANNYDNINKQHVVIQTKENNILSTVDVSVASNNSASVIVTHQNRTSTPALANVDASPSNEEASIQSNVSKTASLPLKHMKNKSEVKDKESKIKKSNLRKNKHGSQQNSNIIISDDKKCKNYVNNINHNVGNANKEMPPTSSIELELCYCNDCCTIDDMLQQVGNVFKTFIIISNNTCHAMSYMFQSFVIVKKDEATTASSSSSSLNKTTTTAAGDNSNNITKVTCVPACVRTPCGPASAQFSVIVSNEEN